MSLGNSRTSSIRTRSLLGCMVLLGTALALATCRSPVSESGPPAPLLPLATGNFWVYADSFFDHGTLVRVAVDTATVTGTDSARGQLWWRLRSRARGTREIGSQVQLRPDGLYALQFGFRGLQYEGATLLAPRDTAYSYHVLFEGDIALIRTVRKLAGRYSVPAGPFRGCVQYDDVLATNILAPGVGVIRRETPVDFFDSTYTTSTLLAYRVR